ncbi:expressed unknown protein [Seminavis robusta]|uniref:Uncharacterized protein n=1 Tax=Seminavis robusta TaxID=568900 RepID=A0A9N8DPC3_9STRA|nr:expressed unknown protein [Seminavis robusta]|eukprot:Sro166_g074260.1 n/a (1152) ;mRNA; r:76212-80374
MTTGKEGNNAEKNNTDNAGTAAAELQSPPPLLSPQAAEAQQHLDRVRSERTLQASESDTCNAQDDVSINSDDAVGIVEPEPMITSKAAAGLQDNDEIPGTDSHEGIDRSQGEERQSLTVGDLLQSDTALRTRQLDPPAGPSRATPLYRTQTSGDNVPESSAPGSTTTRSGDGEWDQFTEHSLKETDIFPSRHPQIPFDTTTMDEAPPDSISYTELVKMVRQLKLEVAELRAEKQQEQQLEKRVSFDTQVSAPSNTGPSSLYYPSNTKNSSLGTRHGSSTSFDDSFLHGSYIINRGGSNAAKHSNPFRTKSQQSSSSIAVSAVDAKSIPLPKQITSEAREVSALTTAALLDDDNSNNNNKGEEGKLKTAEPKRVPRPSEKRWKLLQNAFVATNRALAVDEDEVGTGSESSNNSKRKGLSKKSSLVFMHPEDVKEMRAYTPEELENVKRRPFPSRFFITNIQVAWNTVWLRTRHTDHHAHKSSFIQIRDAFKADAITNNPTGAKYALTELLNMCYGMEESEYYSFACTVASAFSIDASNTEFESSLLLHAPDHAREEHLKKTEDDIRNNHRNLKEKEVQRRKLEHEQDLARKRIRQLLNIVFSKLKQKKILVDDQKNNIYRLVLCMTKYNVHSRLPFMYAAFSFFFQMCAGLYVALSLTKLEQFDDDDEDRWYNSTSLVGRNIALALGTWLYGLMVAFPEVMTSKEVFECLYRSEISWLAVMDLLVNVILPVGVAFCGFFVVLSGETFLDGVLNSVALIFIAEIDDALPRLLELDTKDIVQGFLIDQAIEEYDMLLAAHEKYADLAHVHSKNVPTIEFSDMFLTNTQESGSIAAKGVTFQPYEVFGDPEEVPQFEGSGVLVLAGSVISLAESVRSRKRTRRATGTQVNNKRSVTADCLLRKVEWQYTKGFDDTCVPRVGHLRLTKLNDPKKRPINIRGKNKEWDEDLKPFHSVTGVFIITTFSMSDDVLRLRICGSTSIEGFVDAFDYYSLWPLDRSARDILMEKEIGHTPEEWRANERALNGDDRPKFKLKKRNVQEPFIPNQSEASARPNNQTDDPDPEAEDTLIITNFSASPAKTAPTYSTETQESALDGSDLNAVEEEEIDTTQPAEEEEIDLGAPTTTTPNTTTAPVPPGDQNSWNVLQARAFSSERD